MIDEEYIDRFAEPQQEGFIPVEPKPEEEKKGDDMSDLFEVNREELADTEDVIKVDPDKDILDADEDGTLDDLTEVTEEDVMGDKMYGQTPLEGAPSQRRNKKKYRIIPRPGVYPQPPTISRLNT